jgi:hypothetical protein
MNRTTVCAIHQPNFFPRISTLAKLYAADVWVVLDDVQYNSRDYQNRCRLSPLKLPNEWQWLSLPVRRPSGRQTPIADVRLLERHRSKYRTLHLLKHHYRQSRYWSSLQPALQTVLGGMDCSDRLADVAEASTLALLRLLGWQGDVRRSSALPSGGDRSARLADLAVAVDAGTYLCGTGGRRYLDPDPFNTRDIKITWYAPPIIEDVSPPSVWSQARWNSALWAFMRHGPDIVRSEFDTPT